MWLLWVSFAWAKCEDWTVAVEVNDVPRDVVQVCVFVDADLEAGGCAPTEGATSMVTLRLNSTRYVPFVGDRCPDLRLRRAALALIGVEGSAILQDDLRVGAPTRSPDGTVSVRVAADPARMPEPHAPREPEASPDAAAPP
jgi:hypothetical protein